jgi:hypothetical protein
MKLNPFFLPLLSAHCSLLIATFDGLGKQETIKYTLQGDTLTLESDGETTVLTKK